jgi:hypothetical protein
LNQIILAQLFASYIRVLRAWSLHPVFFARFTAIPGQSGKVNHPPMCGSHLFQAIIPQRCGIREGSLALVIASKCRATNPRCLSKGLVNFKEIRSYCARTYPFYRPPLSFKSGGQAPCFGVPIGASLSTLLFAWTRSSVPVAFRRNSAARVLEHRNNVTAPKQDCDSQRQRGGACRLN